MFVAMLSGILCALRGRLRRPLALMPLMPLLLVLLLLPLAASPAATAATAAAGAVGVPPAQPAAARSLVVLGDSLSAGYGIRVEEGWVALLQRRLDDQGYGYRVVNASVSGETTAGAVARLPRVLAVHHPAVVIVALGSNDGLRGLPIPELRANLGQLVAMAQQAGARVLLLGMRVPSNYGPEYAERFHASYAEVAHARHAARVPFLLERIALEDRYFQPDRLHPTADAQSLLLETVWPALAPLLRAAARPGPRSSPGQRPVSSPPPAPAAAGAGHR